MEMLIPSYLPSSIEAARSFASDNREDLLCGWIPSDETWQKRMTCDDFSEDCWRDFTSMEVKDNAAESSLVHSSVCCKLSNTSKMCSSSAPNLFYKRRKMQSDSFAPLPEQETDCIKGVGPLCDTSLKDGTLGKTKNETDGIKVQSDSFAPLPDQGTDCIKGVGPLCVASLKDGSLGKTKNETDSAGASAVSTGICSSDLIGDGSTSTSVQMHHRNLGLVHCTKFYKRKGAEVVLKSESLVEEQQFGKEKSDSLAGYSDGGEQQSDEAPVSKSNFECCNEQQSDEAPDSKPFECCNGNYSFSSSKSNTGVVSASIKVEVDDPGECSSSGISLAENISEKEYCISILKSHGLLGGSLPVETCSIEDLGIICDSLLCKGCSHRENPRNMLICDNCEEAFHVSCCNPKIKKVPVREWYCNPCSRKKGKFSMESASQNSSKIKYEGSERRDRASKRGASPIELMLCEEEPYTTNVRIGKGFQADVPEWSGPISEEYDCFGEPFEVDPSECGSLDECHIRNTNRLSKHTVGNWLQCREVLNDNTGENEAGRICGKWRRAPLFEVQTDDWDCSCSVLWDPFHSDCAVPQEMETDQVLLHLKYIQLLRPRLGSNKRKPSSTSTSDTTQVDDKPKPSTTITGTPRKQVIMGLAAPNAIFP